MANEKNDEILRCPTLETVLIVEKEIEATSGEYNKTQLWKNLPKKIMWKTFLLIIDYLQSINKIAFDRYNKIGYIWNEELTNKLRLRKEIKL